MNDNQREIEKKFLLKNEDWSSSIKSTHTIFQGYFTDEENKKKRIRLVKEDRKAIIGYKEDIGMVAGFIERIEIENEIDYIDGMLMLFKTSKFIVKNRHIVIYKDKTFEIDVFKNLNFPLTMAELEITSKEIPNIKNIEFPSWLGKDVSDVKKYRNVNLIKHSTDHDFYLKELLDNKMKIKF